MATPPPGRDGPRRDAATLRFASPQPVSRAARPGPPRRCSEGVVGAAAGRSKGAARGPTRGGGPGPSGLTPLAVPAASTAVRQLSTVIVTVGVHCPAVTVTDSPSA